VGVKLNSADFQRGGFDFDESLQVAKWLEAEGVDLLEISGGTYEQPRLLNVDGIEPVEDQSVKASTKAREAYFVDFSQAMRKELTMPLMVTGGLRRLDAMEDALASGSADVIGIGRPLCAMPEAMKALLAGTAELPRFENQLSLLPPWLKFLEAINLFKTVGTFATQYWYYEQISTLGHTGKIDPQLSVFKATQRQMKSAKAWVAARSVSR
jgi:tRNA-dihydrouridine synthase